MSKQLRGGLFRGQGPRGSLAMIVLLGSNEGTISISISHGTLYHDINLIMARGAMIFNLLVAHGATILPGDKSCL